MPPPMLDPGPVASGVLAGLPQRFTVFDLEFTAWEGSQARDWNAPGEYREIIQIGAVVIDVGAACTEVRSMRQHVRPQINPELSEYIVQLTGIGQRTVDEEGVPFAEALARLATFTGVDRPLVCCGLDADVIQENCEIYRVACALAGGDIVDLRPRIAAAFGLSDDRIVSGELPRLVGGSVAAHVHDALEDSRAIARFLRCLAQLPSAGART